MADLIISAPLFNNIDYGQRFAIEVLTTPAIVTCLTCIPAKHDIKQKHFKERCNVEEFYEYVCRIMVAHDGQKSMNLGKKRRS